MALPTHSLAKTQTWCLRTGIWLTLACACLTAMAGWAFGGGGFKSVVFSAVFASVTIGAALLLPFVALALSRGMVLTGMMMGLAWSVFAFGEWAAHLMVFAGHRHSDIQASDIKTINWTDAGKSKEDAERALVRAETNLLDLTEANPWMATVSLQGLEDQLSAKDEAIRQEEARKGCGSKCLKLKGERTVIADRIGKAKSKDAYEQAVEKARGEVGKARQSLAEATKGDSLSSHQASAFGSLIFADLRPDADERDWSNLFLEWFIAFLMTIGPMALVYAGLKDWDAPRRKRGSLISWVLSMVAWVYALLGKKPPGVTVTYNGTLDGISRQRLAAALDQYGVA